MLRRMLSGSRRGSGSQKETVPLPVTGPKPYKVLDIQVNCVEDKDKQGSNRDGNDGFTKKKISVVTDGRSEKFKLFVSRLVRIDVNRQRKEIYRNWKNDEERGKWSQGFDASELSSAVSVDAHKYKLSKLSEN